jgi:hypothetical protein
VEAGSARPAPDYLDQAHDPELGHGLADVVVGRSHRIGDVLGGEQLTAGNGSKHHQCPQADVGEGVDLHGRTAV